jgi:hypothetical protein
MTDTTPDTEPTPPPRPIPVTVPKRQRTRLAKAELLMMLATRAEQLAGEVAGTADGTRPFAEWPEHDPLRQLCVTYALAPADLVRILRAIGSEIENSALRRGYEEAWR